MSSWITNGLKTLRIRVGGTLGAVPQQRQYGAQVKEVQIPAKPKKPLTPYFRYLGEARPEMKRKNPDAKPTEITKLIAQRWETLNESTKQPYVAAYKNEMQSYASLIANYNKSLTPAQKEILAQLRLDKQLDKDKRERKKRLRELGKPKRPASAYFLFVNSKVTQGSGISEYQSAAKNLAEAWKNMSEDEKAPFNTQYKQAAQNYERSLLKWEEQMKKLGHEDLIPEKRRTVKAKAKRSAEN